MAHYVNNADFLAAIKEYKKQVLDADAAGLEKPQVSNYIGECILKIANHLSYKPNFINYSYKDDMILDGIENCIQYIDNFDPDKSSNPFAYFTQIIFYAFLRRIAKEKKQQDIKFRWIEKAGVDDFLSYGDADTGGTPGGTERAFVEELRGRIDKIREVDNSLKEFGKKEKAEEKERKAKGLELFMGA